MIWNEKWISFPNDAPENLSLYIIVQSVDTGIRGSLSCNFPVWIFPFTFISMASPLGSPVWLPFPWSHFSWLWLSTESVSPRRPLWKFSLWPHSKLANERCPLFTLRFYELWMIPWIWQILNKCLMKERRGRSAYQMILIFHFAHPLVFLLITWALWTAKIYSFRWRFISKSSGSLP